MKALNTNPRTEGSYTAYQALERRYSQDILQEAGRRVRSGTGRVHFMTLELISHIYEST